MKSSDVLYVAVDSGTLGAVPLEGLTKMDEPITEEMKRLKAEADQRFISMVRIINDAGLSEVMNSGWRNKGKLAWLAKTVADHRAEIKKILKD